MENDPLNQPLSNTNTQTYASSSHARLGIGIILLIVIAVFGALYLNTKKLTYEIGDTQPVSDTVDQTSEEQQEDDDPPLEFGQEDNEETALRAWRRYLEDEIPTEILVLGDNVLYRHNISAPELPVSLATTSYYDVHGDNMTADRVYVIAYSDPDYSEIIATSKEIHVTERDYGATQGPSATYEFTFDPPLEIETDQTVYMELHMEVSKLSKSSSILISKKVLEFRELKVEDYSFPGFQ